MRTRHSTTIAEPVTRQRRVTTGSARLFTRSLAQRRYVPGYASYSQGLSSSGITWNEVTLRTFIANPDAVVSNNNMTPYKGIKDEAVLTKIIEFLKSARE